MSHDDLIARAKERAEAAPVPEEWGYGIKFENEGDYFVGRWRGTAIDEEHENRPIYLFWDESGEWCFSRRYAALERELERAAPAVGCTIVVYRAAEYVSQQGTGYSFGVETEPNNTPLPHDAPQPEPDGGIPF